MSDCKPNNQGRHCSRRVLALALLTALSNAWPQGAGPPQNTQLAPVPAAKPPSSRPAQPARVKLYLGQAEELLSDSQWEALLATQPTPLEAEPDGSDSAEVVEVKGEKAAVQVPGGVASLFWAMRHPTQAWRIFAPIPP